MREAYRRRRALVVERLGRMPGVVAHPPAGTFYIFPDVSGLLGRAAGNHRIETVAQMCDWLLEEHLVATAPGSAFGEDRCVRISFAASDADLMTGLDRIGEALAGLA